MDVTYGRAKMFRRMLGVCVAVQPMPKMLLKANEALSFPLDGFALAGEKCLFCLFVFLALLDRVEAAERRCSPRKKDVEEHVHKEWIMEEWSVCAVKWCIKCVF